MSVFKIGYYHLRIYFCAPQSQPVPGPQAMYNPYHTP